MSTSGLWYSGPTLTTLASQPMLTSGRFAVTDGREYMKSPGAARTADDTAP